MINFRLEEIQDPIVRDNLQKLEEFLKTYELLKGEWKFFDLDTGATNFNNKRIKHGLRFRPQDVILTSYTNGAVVTWNFDNFTKEYFEVSTDVPCQFRAFIGSRYQGG